jgi:tRNA modification GTPase
MGELSGRTGRTIVAPATPAGMGGVSIVRLSGPEAFPIAGRLVAVPPRSVPPRTLRRCDVRDIEGNFLDSGMAVFFPSPHSFTGEDVAELHLHGSPAVVEAVLRAACVAGAAPAEPGEFSRRAFENGKMDLTQAEGLADLIAARTDAAAKAALRQMRGGIREAILPLRERLLSLLILLSAAIDFAEEDDIPPVTNQQLEERVTDLSHALEPLLRSYSTGHRYRDGATVAIAGVANVGKSRLMNRLAGEERSIVTEVPGTTRDSLHAEVSVAGVPVLLVDTAGLRETGDPVEREGIRRARDVIASADLVLFLLDGSRRAEEGDRLAYREIADRPHLLVLNKADLAAAEAGEGFGGEGIRGVVQISARTGEGVAALVEAVAREVGPGESVILGQAPLTRARHRLAVETALSALARARESARAGLPLEFPAEDVREAAAALAGLLGEVAPEEVLDAVFGQFCVGK